jgi:hypothetical protein
MVINSWNSDVKRDLSAPTNITISVLIWRPSCGIRPRGRHFLAVDRARCQHSGIAKIVSENTYRFEPTIARRQSSRAFF